MSFFLTELRPCDSTPTVNYATYHSLQIFKLKHSNRLRVYVIKRHLSFLLLTAVRYDIEIFYEILESYLQSQTKQREQIRILDKRTCEELVNRIVLNRSKITSPSESESSILKILSLKKNTVSIPSTPICSRNYSFLSRPVFSDMFRNL